MKVTTIGIDLAKSVFALSGADSPGRVVIRRQLRRAQVLGFMRGLPRCVVGMEATGGAQYWARQFTALGHEVRLMSPALVMPYRKGNKTDRNDADAILEAVSRPSMRFVMVKSVAQQDLLALHKVRAQLVKNRTALCNQLRGLLRERGAAVRIGVAGLKRVLPAARWRGYMTAPEFQIASALQPLHAGGVHIWLPEDGVCCELLSGLAGRQF